MRAAGLPFPVLGVHRIASTAGDRCEQGLRPWHQSPIEIMPKTCPGRPRTCWLVHGMPLQLMVDDGTRCDKQATSEREPTGGQCSPQASVRAPAPSGCAVELWANANGRWRTL